MNGKYLNSYSYWFRENNKKTADVIKNKIKDLQTTEHQHKPENNFEVCGFVENCITKSQEKSNGDCFEEIKSKVEVFQPSMFN